jgi:hypothetical protein
LSKIASTSFLRPFLVRKQLVVAFRVPAEEGGV